MRVRTKIVCVWIMVAVSIWAMFYGREMVKDRLSYFISIALFFGFLVFISIRITKQMLANTRNNAGQSD